MNKDVTIHTQMPKMHCLLFWLLGLSNHKHIIIKQKTTTTEKKNSCFPDPVNILKNALTRVMFSNNFYLNHQVCQIFIKGFLKVCFTHETMSEWVVLAFIMQMPLNWIVFIGHWMKKKVWDASTCISHPQHSETQHKYIFSIWFNLCLRLDFLEAKSKWESGIHVIFEGNSLRDRAWKSSSRPKQQRSQCVFQQMLGSSLALPAVLELSRAL